MQTVVDILDSISFVHTEVASSDVTGEKSQYCFKKALVFEISNHRRPFVQEYTVGVCVSFLSQWTDIQKVQRKHFDQPVC